MQTGLNGSYLSAQQARLWPLQAKSSAYRVQGSVLIEGPLNKGILEKVFQCMVDRHEILRTIFYSLPGMDLPVQVATTYSAWVCPIINLERLEPFYRQEAVDTLIAFLADDVFDVKHGPLCHTWMLHLSADTHMLLISLSALCADSFTLKLFVAEFQRTYAAYLQGQMLSEEPLQYADVSAWQNELLLEKDAEIFCQYWDKVDLSQLSTMRLPFEKEGAKKAYDLETQPDSAFMPQTRAISLGQSLQEEFQAAVQQSGISAAAWLLACWQVLHWRLSNEPISLIGVACDGRVYEELNDALGFYTRFLPVATQIEKDWPFEQVLSTVSQSLQEANKWQAYFNWEGRDGVPSNELTTPFFPASFEYDSCPSSVAGEALTFRLHWHFSCTEPFALKLSAFQRGECLDIQLHYDPQRIASEQATYLAMLFRTLVQSAVTSPTMPVGRLEIVLPTEQRSLLSWSRSSTLPSQKRKLHQIFEAYAQQMPDSLAALSAQEKLTYYQLDSQANQLAHLLQRQGVGPNVVVGLSVRRNVQMLVGLLAILKAGGAYVPLDTQWPRARLMYQLQDARPALLLTEQALLEHFSDWQGPKVCLEQVAEAMGRESEQNLNIENDGQDLAYVLYTSGSTGVPKGVMIRQQSIVNYTLAMCQRLEAQPGWHYATVSTLAADLGNTAIFCALATGGCIQVLDYSTITSSEAFARWTQLHPIDVLKIVPSHLSALLAYEQAQQLLPRQCLVLGGEVFTSSLWERLQALGASCVVYNHYGPTETTIGVLTNTLGRPGESEEEPCAKSVSVPLGRPLAGCEVYVLDESLQLTPAGVVGELYIGGEGVAAGYLNQAAQTAQRFVPHPFVGTRFIASEPGARLYRTGDLGYWTSKGQIVFVGRLDSQVKVRGYRIELEEIEAVLRQHPQVWDCAVTLWEEREDASRIVGYVVAQSQSRSTKEALQEFVRQSLPDYMVPTSFVWLERLPLTINGKIDRGQLPEPLQHQESRSLISEAPRSPIEDILLDIWQSLLGMPLLSIHDNFFQLGGHSLLATQVISRVRAVLQVELSITSLFEAPTIAGLAQQVERALRGEHVSVPPALVLRERPEELPLSFAQQRLWFLNQLEPESPAYLVSSALKAQGALHCQALERSLQEVVRRHESLRTIFRERNGQPVQYIMPSGAFHLPIVDLSCLSEQEYQQELGYLATQESQQPVDLAHGPLLRTCLLRLTLEEHVLLLTLHHIITDGWSSTILQRELGLLYQAFAAGQPSPLAPLPLQYADYALWQRAWLQGEILQHQLNYWKAKLAGVAPLALPTDHPRPPVQSGRGASQLLHLPQCLQQDLTALSQREGVTLFMTLLAAFQVLLMRYSGQHDISVGAPIANRRHAEVEGLVGFFVNTLVLRGDLSGQPTFVELLGRVRQAALEAYAHQDVPFEMLVEQLEPQRDLSRSPFFQVSFSLQQAIEMKETLEGVVISPLEIELSAAKFDLTLIVVSQAQGLACHLNYSTELFEAETIQRMLEHWQVLLEGIVAAPQSRLDDLPLLSEWERATLLVDWNDTQVPLPDELCLHTLFEEQVARTPDAIALVYEDVQLTYAALDQYAGQLARYLQDLGVEPDVLVGICLERSLALVVAILGTLKAGGAYLPLAPASPQERLTTLLRETEAFVLITRESLQASFSHLAVKLVCLDEVWSRLAQLQAASLTSRVLPGNLAYVIATSGTTGTPKGVLVTHANVVHSTLARFRNYYEPISSYLLLSPLTFDSSVAGLFWTLCQGGRLVLPQEDFQQDLSQLPVLLEERAISHVLSIPSLYAYILSQARTEQLANMRVVVVAGEACPVNLLEQHQQMLSGVSFFNEYGPTEATVWCSVYKAPYARHSLSQVPIGRPIANAALYVLDHRLQPVPIGVPGELYIAGKGLARGYFKQAGMTAERFAPHPFAATEGALLYRTGDRARYRSDGNIEFLGRGDGQVKLRGYRIELGEIESQLEQHPGVRQSVVVLREDRAGEGRLIGYVVGQGTDADISEERLRSYLREKVPAYMIPQRVVVLQELPLSSNGKVDRAALPVPEADAGEIDSQWLDAGSPIEELLSEIWSQVLARSVRGRHENFFEVGGHSLLATQLVARVRKSLQVELPLRSLFESPTIAGLARRIEQALRAELEGTVPALVARKRPQEIPLSFAQQRLWFLEQLEPGSITYLLSSALRLRGVLHSQALEQCLQEIIRRHEILRTTFEERNGQPVQRIAPISFYCLPVVDLGDLNDQERQQELHRLTNQESQRPFDLVHGPLLRTCLLRMALEEHILLLTMHHIIIDGWSSALLQRELEILYQAFVDGHPSPLEPLPLQYADYALWQREWLQGEVLQRQLSYWKERLAGATALDLPTDHPRPELQSHDGASYSFVLPEHLSASLLTLGKQEGVTLFMTLLASFQTLLYRMTGQTDIVVGTDIANRARMETEALAGFFVNLLALRTDLSGFPTFRNMLQRVREVVLGAYTHQDIPFEMLVEHLRLGRKMNQTPLVQVLFVLQNTPRPSETLAALVFEPLNHETTHARFDLALFMEESTQGMRGRVVYRADLFEEATVSALMRRFEALLQSIVAGPDTSIDVLDIYTDEEKIERAKAKQSIHETDIHKLKALRGKK